jgi:hypothetical protein
MSRSSRRKFLYHVALLPAAALLIPGRAHAVHFTARLCNDCSFGAKKDECARCGKWRGSTSIPARLCSDHGFGAKGDNCARCGKWVGQSKAQAYVCNDCGFGSKKENCVKCGKWAP